jgi:hypothetical protein
MSRSGVRLPKAAPSDIPSPTREGDLLGLPASEGVQSTCNPASSVRTLRILAQVSVVLARTRGRRAMRRLDGGWSAAPVISSWLAVGPANRATLAKTYCRGPRRLSASRCGARGVTPSNGCRYHEVAPLAPRDLVAWFTPYLALRARGYTRLRRCCRGCPRDVNPSALSCPWMRPSPPALALGPPQQPEAHHGHHGEHGDGPGPVDLVDLDGLHAHHAGDC